MADLEPSTEAMEVTNPSLAALQATRTVSFARGPMDRIELARLLDAFAAQEVQRERERHQWQPIETARERVKPSEHVLLWWPYWSHGRAIIGWRREVAGFEWDSHELLTSYRGDQGPTLWQPLPEPPEDKP